MTKPYKVASDKLENKYPNPTGELKTNIKGIKINGFTLALTGEVFEIKSRGWINYPVRVIVLPDSSKSMPRDTLDLLIKQDFFGEEIQGVESFAKGNVAVGDVIGIAVKNRLNFQGGKRKSGLTNK